MFFQGEIVDNVSRGDQEALLKTRFVYVGGLLVLALWLAPQLAGAAPRYWVGASNALWSASGSWATSSGGASGAGAPGAADDVIFDAGGVSNALVDAAFAGSVLSVTITNGYTGTITQSNNLSVVYDFTMSTGTWQFITGIAGTLNVGNNMTVSNATLYCQRISTVGNGTGRVITVGGNLTVATNGAFNANGLGFDMKAGPGAGDYSHGAGYGGDGGYHPTSTYGSVTAPTSLGSGGGNDNNAIHTGGGAIKLVVTGTVTLASGALISANGNRLNSYAGGGAGGSVFIQCGSLQGNGTISAKGGGTTGPVGGGGGRIAIWLTSGTDFGGVKQMAYGGVGGDIEPYGAAGTIYLQTPSQTEGQGALIVDNNNYLTRYATTMLLSGTALNGFSAVVITNKGNLGICTNVDFSLAKLTTFGVNNSFITIRSPALNIAFPTNIAGYTLNLDVPVSVPGDWSVSTNGRISHTSDADWHNVKNFAVDLTLSGNLAVLGQINVDSKGWAAQNGPGVGNFSNGAGHGGQGGGGIGTTYGSITNPATLGSGGQDGDALGGGAIKLTVASNLTVDVGASISARSVGTYDSNGNTYDSGGSGGSICIRCGTLTGTGAILADGGASAAFNGGGGGHIAIFLANSDDFGSVTNRAYGALSGIYASIPQPAAAGTIYRQKKSDRFGTLVVDNNNRSTTAATLIATNATDTMVGDVIRQKRGNLGLGTNATLTVCGSWTNDATSSFTAQTNSTVAFFSTNVATIYGSNVFWNLTATNSGKVLTFEAGRTNTVQGKITLANVMLNSTVNGQYTYLTLSTNGGSQQIGAVTVQDNNAGGGQQMLAGPRSANNGHNVNWKFPVSGTTFFFR